MSLYTSSSNFRFLSQGVAAAIQKRHLLADPVCAPGRGEAVAGIPTALKAAAAPRPSRNVLRVVSMVFLLSLLARFFRRTKSKTCFRTIPQTTHAVVATEAG